MNPLIDLSELRRRNPRGFYDQARLAKLTHTVTCHGLNEEHLGQSQSCQELQSRREWIASNCQGDWAIEPVRDNQQRLTGRVFRFASQVEAASFKLVFPISL